MFLVGCGNQAAVKTGPAPGELTKKATRSAGSRVHLKAGEHFVDKAQQWGLSWTHNNGASGQLYFPEILGPGVALFDFDLDGDLDVYVTQGVGLGKKKSGTPTTDSDRLFRNDIITDETGARRCKFVDVTAAAGIVAPGNGMGVVTADFDNDGWPDLYVTNYGANQFWRNNGDGTFSDVTSVTGTTSPLWSTSATALDINRDGWLDLFVGNYVQFTLGNHRDCFDAKTGKRIYCTPSSYPAVSDRLFLNRGDGTFADISASSQIARRYGAALGVIAADFNGDHWPDLYVANDANPNHLWINQKNNTFKDIAVLAGCALNDEGIPEGSMGVDAGDYDKDGDDDLFMTHVGQETNTLYRYDQTRRLFRDESASSRLATPSRGLTGFGTAWFDFDNDSWLDLFVANGDVNEINLAARGQRNQLFLNLRDGQFAEVGHLSGKVFDLVEVSRAAAFGDLDNDGDIDIVITNNAGPLRVLVNQLGQQQRWLGLRLIDQHGTWSSPTRVEIRTDGKTLWRRARSDGSYLAAHDPRVVVGLGTSIKVTEVLVHWASGRVETWRDLELRKYNVLQEGQGVSPSPK